MTNIYYLVCPISSEVRYIGKADDVEKRLVKHVSQCSRQRHHRARWIGKLQAQGLMPVAKTLFRTESWQMMEMFFIASALSFGFPLTNSTAGGDGVVIIDEDVRRRMSESAKERLTEPARSEPFRAASAAWRESEEGKSQQRRLMSERMNDPAMKARMYASQAAAFATEDCRMKRKAGMLIRDSDPAVKAKQVAAAKLRYQDPEQRAKTAEATRLSWQRRKQQASLGA